MSIDTIDRRLVKAVYALVVMGHPNAPKRDVAKTIEAILDADETAEAQEVAKKILERVHLRVTESDRKPKRRRHGYDWSGCHEVTISAAEYWAHEMLVSNRDFEAEPVAPAP